MTDTPPIQIDDSTFDQLISVLTKFVESRSISLEGSHTNEMKNCRDLVADQFKKLGASVQLLEIDGAPDAVYAELPHSNPNAPIILLYSHYDVQPVGDLSNWTSEPFETTVRDNRIFGRGASDDKSGIITHIGALQSILASDSILPCHVKIIIEGEEELGSPHASEFLEKYKELLRADAVIIADSVHWGVDEPAITTSLRGLVDCEIVVKTLELGVHSGEYGGIVPDALMTLSRIITSLHNEDGTVAVEGLVSKQTNEIEKRFPSLAQSDFNTGLRLIEENQGNETVHVGADAVYQIYRRLPPYHLAAWVYRLPVLKQVFRGAYALIARNRHRFGKVTCETAACDVPYSEQTVRRT